MVQHETEAPCLILLLLVACGELLAVQSPRGALKVCPSGGKDTLVLVTWKNNRALPVEGDVPCTNTLSTSLPQKARSQKDICEHAHILAG